MFPHEGGDINLRRKCQREICPGTRSGTHSCMHTLAPFLRFEELCSDLLSRAKVPVENALRDAKLSMSDINEVRGGRGTWMMQGGL